MVYNFAVYSKIQILQKEITAISEKPSTEEVNYSPFSSFASSSNQSYISPPSDTSSTLSPCLLEQLLSFQTPTHPTPPTQQTLQETPNTSPFYPQPVVPLSTTSSFTPSTSEPCSCNFDGIDFDQFFKSLATEPPQEPAAPPPSQLTNASASLQPGQTYSSTMFPFG